MRQARPLLAIAAATGLLLAPAARADGDPASDVLATQDVFVSYVVPQKLARQIAEEVAAANKAGYPLKVALIATRSDLGLVQGLWLKPEQYARFLGSELRYFYKRTLVIEMPNRFGVSSIEGRVDRERRVLAGIRPGPGPEGLAKSMLEAVRKLSPARSSGGSSDALDRALIGAGAAVLLAALVLTGRYVRQRRSTQLRAEE